MKINEIVQEGIFKSLAKGMVNAAAPGAWDSIQQNIQKHRELAPIQKPEQVPAPAQTTEPTTSINRELTKTPQGVSIVNAAPLILQFDNQKYIQNENGDWVHTKGNRPVNPGMQSFLDKQVEILHPATPALTQLGTIKITVGPNKVPTTATKYSDGNWYVLYNGKNQKVTQQDTINSLEKELQHETI